MLQYSKKKYRFIGVKLCLISKLLQYDFLIRVFTTKLLISEIPLQIVQIIIYVASCGNNKKINSFIYLKIIFEIIV